MFDSRVLDVVVGISAVYALLSLGCSWIQEWIAAVTKLRARVLEKALKGLLREPGLLYRHPLLAGMSRVARPSYVPSFLFVRAVLPEILPDKDGALPSLRHVVSQIEDDNVRAVAEQLSGKAAKNIDELRSELERWFDAQMERVSGWYKRRAQLGIVIVATVLTCVMHIDSVLIAQHLWQDESMRSALAQRAEQMAENGELEEEQGLAALLDVPVPVGWELTSGGDERRYIGSDATNWVRRLFGFAITILAASLGAPFWFDLLNRLARFRLVGQRPAESPSPPR
jgi:hypothetical protein